jgi:hypothetical protein
MKVFLSGVTAQFKESREAIGSDLRANDCQVFTQEDFKQGPRTLLAWLQEYISRCDCVIALVGDAYGCEVPEGGAPVCEWPRSYTQWEYYLGIGERLDGSQAPPKDVYVYFASEAFLESHAVQQEPRAAALQARFREAIVRSGKHWGRFDSVDALGRAVLRDLGLAAAPARAVPDVVVERIVDAGRQRDDLWQAVSLYCSRLPEEERYDAGEFQELITHHLAGDFGPHRSSENWKMYCLVAKWEGEVVGMLLAFEDRSVQLGFVSYLVSRKPRRGKSNPADINRRLLEALLVMMGDGKGERRLRVLAEVDDPAKAPSEKERIKRLARIKLFEQVAANLGVALRCADHQYVQPQLDPTKPEVPMLLLYIVENPPAALARAEMVDILTWVYTGLYSRDILSDPVESERYGEYLNALIRTAASRLPERIRLIRGRQLPPQGGEGTPGQSP